MSLKELDVHLAQFQALQAVVFETRSVVNALGTWSAIDISSTVEELREFGAARIKHTSCDTAHERAVARNNAAYRDRGLISPFWQLKRFELDHSMW